MALHDLRGRAFAYSDYLTQKKPAATYKEPLLAGGVFILASLFLTIAFY